MPWPKVDESVKSEMTEYVREMIRNKADDDSVAILPTRSVIKTRIK